MGGDLLMTSFLGLLLLSALCQTAAVNQVGHRQLQKKKDRKVGAGILLYCSDETAVVLLRGFNGDNPRTWDLPGGNHDPSKDIDLLATAIRELKEEMGRAPQNMTLTSKIKTKRGKDDNLFTAFLMRIPIEAKEKYYPILNDEHTAWKWFSFDNLFAIPNKHPVLRELLHDHREDVEASLGILKD